MHRWLVTLAEAKAAPIPEGARSALLMRHGTMTLRYYAPRGRDPQTPHAQDEIYVVVAGRARFTAGEEVRAVGPGDVLFVPAGVPHRFHDITEELRLTVVFAPPEYSQGE